MSDRHLDEDLAWLPIRLSERRRVARSAALRRYVPPDEGRSARDERLEDALRPSEVAAAWRAASRAPPGASGEGARRRLRLVGRPFVDRVTDDARAEVAGRRVALDVPERGFDFEISTNPAPDERLALHRRWADVEARLAEPRGEQAAVAWAAALRVGADSTCDFLAAEQPQPPEALCAAYEPAFMTPLDDAIVRASRDRRLRSPWPLLHPEQAADSPVARALTPYGERFPSSGIPAVLRVLGGALGCDVPTIRDAEACFRPRPWVTRSGAHVILGAQEGPGALAAALSAFGRMARRSFVAGTRGAVAAATADPACDAAAGVLFGRLVLSGVFRGRFGPRPHDGLDADLRLECALAPRLAWTYLYLALLGRRYEGVPPSGEVGRALGRALGRPGSVDQCLVPYGADPRGAAVLRGTVLALLLEERLLSRLGRDWFLTGSAGRLLRECWEAEDGLTAESVANELDLGTIEPTPILDGCRP